MNKLIAGTALTLSFMSSALKAQFAPSDSSKAEIFATFNTTGKAIGIGGEYRFANAADDNQTLRFRNAFVAAGLRHYTFTGLNEFHASVGSDLLSLGSGPASDRLIGIGPEVGLSSALGLTYGPYVRIGRRDDDITGKISLQESFGFKSGSKEMLVFGLKFKIDECGKKRRRGPEF